MSVVEIGIQYTRFSRDRSIRQCFMNIPAPDNLIYLSDDEILDIAVEAVKQKHHDDLVMIDAVNKEGPVDKVYDLES